MNEKESLAFFEEIRPYLAQKARFLNITDYDTEISSWLEKYIKIINGINSGKYLSEKYIKIKNDKERMRAYICKAFTYDMYKHKKSKNKEIHIEDLDNVNVSINNRHLFGGGIYLDDLIEIINIDINRLEQIKTSLMDQINIIVMTAIKYFVSDLRVKFGNISIVRNIAATASKTFFIEEIYDGRKQYIYNYLNRFIKETDNPIIKNYLYNLIKDGENSHALIGRVKRYMLHYNGGLASRLLKMKNK